MLNIAFLISAYKEPLHLAELIKHLPSGADFFIHVDAYVDIEPFRIATKGMNVRFVDHRLHVAWGSFTQVEYQITLLEAALNSNPNYDFLFILSAQDYPVWSNKRILQFLENNKDRNFIQAICMDGQAEQYTKNYTQNYYFNNVAITPNSLKSKIRIAIRRIAKLIIHKPLAFNADGRQYRLYKGSDYFALTGDTAAYVLQQWHDSPELRKYFYTGFAPSETCIHTILFNSPYSNRCILSTGTYHSLKSLTPLTYIDYSPIIKELTEADYDKIISSDKMFCRKVVTGVSDKLVSMLDKRKEVPKEL